ncbi:MAG: DUF4007 family protein [Saprospiraceae bacterium]
MNSINRPVFSGHESFQCRHLWLKKGYDFVQKEKSFSADDTVVELGVGKNMASSIRYWIRAFNLSETGSELTEFAHRLFSDDGYDPYLEDDGSLWLLHYHLVKKGFATSYSLIFNELRKEKIEFSKANFVRFMQAKDAEGLNFNFNKNTIESDFDVFTKLYFGTTKGAKDKEEVVAGILPDLQLLKIISKGKNAIYYIETNEKEELPEEIILYALLSDENIGKSISLDEMERGYNSIGSIFALNRSGIVTKIEQLVSKFDFLVYKDDAGVRELQFKSKPNPYKILDKYYNGN